MKKLGKKGMTLVEVIASLVILGIIMTPITSIFYMGYKNYFVENDIMTAQQAAKEVLKSIIDDLRAYENEYTEVDNTLNTLTLKYNISTSEDDNIGVPEVTTVYKYDENKKMVFKNDTSIIDNTAILITDFKVQETRPSGYDSSIIRITVTVNTGKSEDISLENNYRRKYE